MAFDLIRGIDWKGRATWTRIDYALSAAWMIGVLYATGGDPAKPLFVYIFVVPLAGWVIGLLVARLLRRR